VRWKPRPLHEAVVLSSTSTSSRLTSSSTVSVSSTTRAELRLLACGWRFSRVFTVSWDYVEAPQGTARPIIQAVDKVQGGSCGQKG
jgi:hypothetical protein